MKVLWWLVRLVALGVVGLATLWTASISVGYMNLTMTLWSLQEQAGLAMDYPLAPGDTAMVTMRDGELVKQRGGRVFITRKVDGDRFVTFDRGGGHLGHQGYVYAPYADDDAQVHQDAFGGFEGREVSHLYGSWWCYDSTEN
ncbi:MAG: hypothetical protein QF464_11870 [Myxococcota bacterium]|jgi:hypothetical protein|nr:hypothetical protein [Myxococcota bacterium]